MLSHFILRANPIILFSLWVLNGCRIVGLGFKFHILRANPTTLLSLWGLNGSRIVGLGFKFHILQANPNFGQR